MIVPVVLLVSVFAFVAFFSVNYMLTPGISSSSNSCNLSITENCYLKNMNNGYPSYLVKPDKSAGTYCIDSSPYQFEVKICSKKLYLQMN